MGARRNFRRGGGRALKRPPPPKKKRNCAITVLGARRHAPPEKILTMVLPTTP